MRVMNKRSYEELEKELLELKNIHVRDLKNKEYKMLFDSMPEMIEVIEVIYNKSCEPIDFYIRDINLSFAKFLGKPREQLINKKGSSIIGKIAAQHWVISFSSVDKTGKQISFKNYSTELDTYYYVLSWKISKNRVGISFTEITENEKAEIEKQKFNETILDNIPADIAVFDKNHNYLYVNPNGIRDLETRKWMIGKNDFEYCGFKNLDNSLAQNRRDLFNKSIQTNQQIEWVDKYNKEGEDVFIMRKFYPVFIDDIFHYVIGYGMDISELTKAKIELSQLNNSLEEKVNDRTVELINSEKKLKLSLLKEKELGELNASFVSTASHQFRTPLAVIQSNTELLEMFVSTGEKIETENYKRVTGRITGAIARMTGLMDDVFILGKLTSGNIGYKPKEVDLIRFCEVLAKQFNAFQTDGRSINIVTDGEAYKTYLDPNLLSHALCNLISNAFKYSLRKINPELFINFKPTEYVLSIKDYGIGISQEEQSNLFQPFFRANNVSEIKGTGLGLSIAKEYVEINRGHISVKSKLGEGSCFEITFKRK